MRPQDYPSASRQRIQLLRERCAPQGAQDAARAVPRASLRCQEDGEPSLRLWALSLFTQDRTGVLSSYQQFVGMLEIRRALLDLELMDVGQCLGKHIGQWKGVLGA